jgi:hypothetical protein
MSIDFTPARWQQVKENYRRWWAGELKRPLLHLTVHGARDAGRPEPKLPEYGFTARHGLKTPAEEVVDRWDYDLSRNKYLGDSFPCLWPNFGPGALAAFLGAELHADENTVWFRPLRQLELSELEMSFDPKNAWLNRVISLCQAAMKKWQGLVQVGMTDLGGNLDVLSTFRPSELLLLDLYDNPDDVKRLSWEIFEMWWRCFREVKHALQGNPGYTAWTPIFSETPYYMLQCDFCYMIGPKMFDEFVKPELAASCARLKHAFYHLDGKGELPHLDSLLEIKELRGVQWIPGDGQPDMAHWPEVYRKIRKAGKLIQLFGGLHVLDAVVEQVGSPEGIIYIGGVGPQDQAKAEALLKKYGGC